MDDSLEWLYYSRGHSRPENLKKRPGQKNQFHKIFRKNLRN